MIHKALTTNSYHAALLLFLLLAGCTHQPEEKAPEAQRISTAGNKASSPYLTQDHQGKAVLCWIEETEPGEHLLTYATSADGGKTFDAPRAIPTTKGVYPHDENLSKLLYKANGDMMALFAISNPNPQNSYAGLVFYTQSFDGGNSWTAPLQLAENTVNSTDERYFDIALLPDGEIGAVWLDSRKDTDKEGSSLYYASTSGRKGFKGEKVIDRQLCQCCRTDLFVDDARRLHVAYRGILNDSIRDMLHLVSTDNGNTFSSPERISPDNWVIRGCPHTGPALAATGNILHAAWYTMGGGSGVFYSQKNDVAAFAPRAVVSREASARHPQLAAPAPDLLAIVWDERKQQAGSPGNSIGFQLRKANGEVLTTSRLTPDSVSAIYPVILPVGKQELLVAYTRQLEKSGEVWWQVVQVPE